MGITTGKAWEYHSLCTDLINDSQGLSDSQSLEIRHDHYPLRSLSLSPNRHKQLLRDRPA